MFTHKRHKGNRKKLNTKRRSQHGGLLVMNPSTDLRNTHMCNTAKESIADEIYTYNGNIFQLNRDTVGFLVQQFKQSDHKWFKFVVFNNDGNHYISIVNGGQINKHSVCMLIGLLEVTFEKGEYVEIREAVNQLQQFKLNYTPEQVFSIPILTDKFKSLKEYLNQLVLNELQCMPVVCAGSGTVMPDNTICINNKSGHYKPTLESMETAKHIFEEHTGMVTTVSEKANKKLLKSIYGDAYENYTGICLQAQTETP